MAEFKHFFLSNTSSSAGYTATGGGSGTFRSPPRDSREDHGNRLLGQLAAARESAATSEEAADPNVDGTLFVPLAIEGTVGELEGSKLGGLDLKKLHSDAKGIRVVNVCEDGDRQIATIAIPKDQLDYFEKKLTDYLTKDTKSSKPANQQLVESINDLRLARLSDFYTDSDRNIPAPDESIWWEVWLEYLPTDEQLEEFKERAEQAGLSFSQQSVRFPEAVVVLAQGTLLQWAQVVGLWRNLAEFRRAKIVASEFMDLPPSDQAEFIDDLLNRTTFADSDAPAVTLLDTGINRGHPLLNLSAGEEDVQAWDDEWGANDVQGHGTEMAGVALFGPRLKDLLANEETIELSHRIESVKILPDVGENDPPDYGPITVGSMEKAEAASPNRNRVFCLAITADDRDKFLPTLWSAAIDQAVSGRNDEQRRLITISAGNLFSQPGENYPDINQLASVQDPAQSWNALTIGACTDLVQLQESEFDGWNPVAPKGRLSPTSTTSVAWRKQWPIKPELVLEGGNCATDGKGEYSDAADLSLLTTRLAPTGALLGTTHATSPAAGQAARMGAIVQANYPEYWPETVRGMLVHNANWTKEMEEEFPARRKSKIPAARLRVYGWGVPDLDRSLSCAKHIATMVIQDSLQPYCLGDDGKPRTNEMKLHSLPLPREELAKIGNEEVEMRVTLSYFVEPSPGRKGWTVNHRYASHGLRFDVIRPLEDIGQFQQRISRDFWDGSDEDDAQRVRPEKGPQDDRHWAIGEFGQTKGSIHSDFWIGSAGQLAESNSVAVFPITGWWRERPGLQRVDSTARYSLIVTIRTRKTELDIYNWVASEIGVPVEIVTEV